MAVKMLTVIINDPQGQMSKEQVEQAVISTLNSRRASDSSTDYMADTFIVRTKEQFYVVDDQFKQTLNASSNVLQSDYITSKQLEEKLAQLKVSEDNDDAVVINPEGITLAKAQELLALKLDKSSYEVDKATFATKDEVYNKSEVDNKIATVSTGGSVNLDGYVREEALDALATKDELNNYALKSEINTSGGIDENTLNQAINQNATIQELGSKVNHLATNLQGATYTQLVATMKYLGYELPSELRAYADYNLYADDRLSGDLTIGFTPISYTGSYGQAWENVAIYNELGEKLTAKYASISSDGLNIDAVFAKDIAHPKGDSFEAVPSDYVLADGEVRVSITLGAVSYYGATYGLRMLNNNPSSWSESFLGGSHSYDEWIFTFHNYKPTKFSITNGTATYGDYGYMTRYEMRLSIGNWSKTLTYENSNYPNNIEIDFTNLNFGSDAKTIELAKAWNVPVTQYDINSDIVGE